MTASASAPPSDQRVKLILFFTIFIAMLGLSVLFPIIAPLARQLGLSETQAGWFSTAYSLAQFIFSPIWGSRSERVGRKPLLVMGLIGFSLSFGLFALFAQLGMSGALSGALLFGLLVLSRLIGGTLSSATLPTAQAMMADLSPEQDRAASMGLIGAAFGLGVIFGPALGAALSQLSLTTPIYFSAGLGLLTALLAWLTLPETRRPDQLVPVKGERRGLLVQGAIPLLLLVSALSTLASVGMEQTIGFYVQDNLKLSTAQVPVVVGGMLTIFGFVSVLVQGGLIRVLSKKVKPTLLLNVGLVVMALGMLGLAQSQQYWPLTLALAVVGVGSALIGPSLSSALSLSVSRDQQGSVAGLNSSALALGRLSGPLISTGLYQNWSPRGPYLLSAAILVALLLITLLTRPQPDG